MAVLSCYVSAPVSPLDWLRSSMATLLITFSSSVALLRTSALLSVLLVSIVTSQSATKAPTKNNRLFYDYRTT
jgi:hypothetical protein